LIVFFLVFLLFRLPSSSSLFPYTTLFRSLFFEPVSEMNQSAARHYPSHRLVSSVPRLPLFEKHQYFSSLSSPCKTSFIQVNYNLNRAIFSSFCILACFICLIIVSNFSFSISDFLKKIGFFSVINNGPNNSSFSLKEALEVVYDSFRSAPLIS